VSDENSVVTRARFTEDLNGGGPLLELPDVESLGDQWYTIERDGEQVDIRRDECREVAASLIAFADGAP